MAVNYECTPAGCGNAAWDRSVTYGYDLGGNQTSEVDGVAGSISYGRSPAGEVTLTTQNTYGNATNPANLVSSVANTTFGPNTFSLGNGLTGVRTYDGLERISGGRLHRVVFCVLLRGTQLYGNQVSYTGQRVTNVCDTVLGECAIAINSVLGSVSTASTLAGANDTSPLGVASTLVSAGSLIGGAFIPVVGQALSAVGFFIGVAKTYNAVQACPQ